MPSSGPHAPDAATGRRDLLKKVAVGGAAVWVAPAITSAPAAAQQGSSSLVVQVECLSAGFRIAPRAPASYVGGGYFYRFIFSAPLTAWDSCDHHPTTYPVIALPSSHDFNGFGVTGPVVVSIHDGDCVPIVTMAVQVDCGTRRGPDPDRPVPPGGITTRSETGEITVTRR